MMKTIDKFIGEYRWLSNFWLCPIKINDLTYPSVENAYQAFKTEENEDRIEFTICSPGKAKRLGRTVLLRQDWNSFRLRIMRILLKQKFTEGNLLSKKLIATKNIKLIEGNTWGDIYWGVCNKVGKNKLGKLIMEVRLSLYKN